MEADAKKNCLEVLATTNLIEEAVMTNNCIFSGKWEETHEQINCRANKHQILKTCVIELKSLLGFQQTSLQHCQDMIAGLEETVAQLVMSVKKLEKSICRCHNRLLLPGPHYTPGEEEEMVEEEEEEEEDKDGLEYKTDVTSQGSYTTPLSTGGHSKPSPAPSCLPSSEDSNPEANVVLCTAELEACIESFLEEVEGDLELDDLPPLENITLLPVLVPTISGFVPFTVSTSQHCVLPKSLLRKVYHPYKDPVG